MQSLIRKGTAFLTPSTSSTNIPTLSNGKFKTAPEGTLFDEVDPAVDGEGCDQDCDSCHVKYPPKWSIDEDDRLYGHVNGWATHLVVATGKSDWVRDVKDEKGSVMEAVGEAKEPGNGKLMLSASNYPLPDEHYNHPPDAQPTTCLLLPAFTIIEDVTPASVPELIKTIINNAPTTTTPTKLPKPSPLSTQAVTTSAPSTPPTTTLDQESPTTSAPTNGDYIPPPTSSLPETEADATPVVTAQQVQNGDTSSTTTILSPPSSPFKTRPIPHRALILLCSQKTRDARCGQSAPLLRREFERHLRSLGLYRDMHDSRPGGVGVYFISHVGGHKYAANVMVYRKGEVESADGDGKTEEGVQGIWLARVRPEDCEGIIKQTVLKGKVVKPGKQLRGGFDREKGLVSW